MKLVFIKNQRCHIKTAFESLLEFYKVWARRTTQAGGNDVWAGDDLGTQRSLFMPPDIFRDIYKPLADILHENGLDFWLHTCGNVHEILEDIVQVGVDVIHPIQVGTATVISATVGQEQVDLSGCRNWD